MSEDIIRQLFELQDKEYKAFHSRLIPEINDELIIGVRVPEIRKLAKKLIMEGKHKEFIAKLPHRYYDENMLHVFILNEIKDFDILLYELERFLPFVDNWAVCDSLRPVVFADCREKILSLIFRCLKSDYEFAVRFGIEMLMIHFLDECFSIDSAQLVAGIKSDKYYINMMIAWYFATALSKQWDKVIGVLEARELSVFAHNKTISKACDSRRISVEQKKYLKMLRINEKG